MFVCAHGDSTAHKREFKGRSILGWLVDYVVIDIETTGLDPSYDEIIEVAAIKYSHGNECARFSSLIKPEANVDDFITRLTGITNDMLSTAPPIEDVLPAFIDFLGDSVLVGHNVNFDINFLYDFSLQCGLMPLSNNFVDTMRISRRLYKTMPNHRLATIVVELGVGEVTEHRAMSDALQTHLCYTVMQQYASQSGIDIETYCVSTVRAHDIVPTVGEFDPEHPLFGKVCVFTGVLQKLQRADAMQLVVNCGGSCADSVSKKVHYLILGNNDYCPTITGGKSSKYKKAEALKLAGHDIEIFSENVFYDMVLAGAE